MVLGVNVERKSRETRSGARIHLELELVREAPLLLEAMPALEAARERGAGEELARAAERALPILAAAVSAEEARVRSLLGAGASLAPEVAAGKLAQARLEAVLALRPEPPSTEAALEEVAWALLRAARVAPPVSLGEDWDLLRILLDPARRRVRGVAGLAATLSGSALVGAGPLATPSGFALARARSYATGWNDPARTRRIARALARTSPARLERAAARISTELARGIYPGRRTGWPRRLERARVALDRLKSAYQVAADAGAGVFLELEIV
jgi:hypothetical protein